MNVGAAAFARSVDRPAPLRPAAEATATEWRWRGWTHWPLTPAVVLVAGFAVAADFVVSWFGIVLGHLGRVPVAVILPVGIVLACMVGLRHLGLDRANLLAWREFLVVASAALLFGLWQYSTRIGGFPEAMGLVIAALNEELIYRLAVLIVVGAVAAKVAGRNWRDSADWGVGPGVAAIAASGVVFMLLPGHLAQVSDSLHALPFVALGAVLGYVVMRTGALLPAAIAHAVLNLATLAALSDEISHGLRMSLAAAALVALVVGTHVAGRRLGRFGPERVAASRASDA